jgi:hypothetical protein
VSSTFDDVEAAERHAEWAREHRPEATVSIVPRLNPNYRQDCGGDIPVRALYVDYIGEAAFAESGSPLLSPLRHSCLGSVMTGELGYPVGAVLQSAIRDALCYRLAKIPADCCSPDRPCGEHVEDADCIAAYEWLARYIGITTATDGMTSPAGVHSSPQLNPGGK